MQSADDELPSLWRTLRHALLCDDFQLGLAEYRQLSGVLLIRARHAYPSVDWEWRD
jgi:hypothetical protein